MCKMYRKMPSEILGLEDIYTAYCLNEACAYIMQQLNQKKEPHFRVEYKTFSELYSQYEDGGGAT